MTAMKPLLFFVALANYVILKLRKEDATLWQRIKNPAFEEVLWALISPVAIAVCLFIPSLEVNYGSGDWMFPAIILSSIWLVITKFWLNINFAETIQVVMQSLMVVAACFLIALAMG